jgi:NAD(P)-dependent dehydrogenase (short-subunit alcohol dehydrogenase family)
LFSLILLFDAGSQRKSGAGHRRAAGAVWGNGKATAVPISRMADAWDCAHAIVFLASDEARYITVAQLVVDAA